MNIKNKIYITGANGWLGRNLLEYLAKVDPEIHCIVLLEPGDDKSFLMGDTIIKDLHITIEWGNITDEHSCSRFLSNSEGSTVIHLAGVIHPNKYRDFQSVNFLGTKNISDLCLKNNVKKLIYLSSNSPYGTNKKGKLFDQHSSYKPYLGYGKSKMEAEKYVTQLRKEGLKSNILKAPWFYGPHQPLRQTTFFNMIKKGLFPLIGNGKNLRSMTYTKNLAHAIYLCYINKKVDNLDFWIADEKAYSFRYILETIREIMIQEYKINVPKNKLRLPHFFGEIAYFFDLLIQKIGLYNQEIHVMGEVNKTIACDIEYTKKKLGYYPMYNIKSGMKESLDWLVKNGFKL
tara:strand:- start:5603 stop:6637 length:1035 start_codon:yes stop_codon:yes gene_type:complete